MTLVISVRATERSRIGAEASRRGSAMNASRAASSGQLDDLHLVRAVPPLDTAHPLKEPGAVVAEQAQHLVLVRRQEPFVAGHRPELHTQRQ